MAAVRKMNVHSSPVIIVLMCVCLEVSEVNGVFNHFSTAGKTVKCPQLSCTNNTNMTVKASQRQIIHLNLDLRVWTQQPLFIWVFSSSVFNSGE